MILDFLNKKNPLEDLYLGMILKEKEGMALILALKNEKIELLEKEKFVYSNGWENLTEDVDEILFKLENSLNITVNKVIFFIYSHLLNEEGREIKKNYLSKIKELVKNLELSPLGYVECYEALYSYLSEKEQVSLTAILVELDVYKLSIFVYKGGKLSYKKTLVRSKNLIEDLTAGFSELKGKFLLPSRIILYDSKDLDNASTKILTHRWSEDYFVQLPKVEILNEEEIIKAIVYIFEKEKTYISGTAATKKKKEKKEVLGFIIGGDIAEEKTNLASSSSFKPPIFLFKIWERMKMMTLPKIGFSPNLLMVIGFLFIFLGLTINEVFFHKATLILYLPSQVIEKSLTLELPYKIATISGEFTESKATSGRREVGDKARGEVTIYNTNLNKEKLFKKGTEIEFDGLRFIFDDDVKVASASGATTPGIAKVKVTAVAIGSEYNLSKGKRFNIDDTSYAQSTVDFTGGSKKEIQTIAQKDIEDLKRRVVEKAKKTIKFTPTSSGNEIPVSEFSIVNLKEEILSGEVGEEATSVTLKAKAETTYYYYQKDQLLAKITGNIASQIPSGFVLSNKENINYKTNSVKKKDQQLILDLSLKTKAVKKISKEKVLKQVVGKNRSVLNNLLQQKFKVEGYEANIKNSLPIMKEYLPFISDNITLIISNL
ncbi:MAG: baseplate J/gp47 family protein [Microgenomates group bacterium]